MSEKQKITQDELVDNVQESFKNEDFIRDIYNYNNLKHGTLKGLVDKIITLQQKDGNYPKVILSDLDEFKKTINIICEMRNSTAHIPNRDSNTGDYTTDAWFNSNFRNFGVANRWLLNSLYDWSNIIPEWEKGYKKTTKELIENLQILIGNIAFLLNKKNINHDFFLSVAKVGSNFLCSDNEYRFKSFTRGLMPNKSILTLFLDQYGRSSNVILDDLYSRN